MLSLLAAYSKNRVIGSEGKIPWNLPSERNRFKSLCAGKKIIMGRKSFEEIGHGLSYCTIIIVSTTLKAAPQGCLLAKNLEQALLLAEGQEILIAGGETLYRQTINKADKIYATEIDAVIQGNTFFPQLPEPEKWTKTVEKSFTEKGLRYSYVTWSKIK